MPNYVDGFVIPVPQRNLGAYKKMALKAAKIWKEHGALDYCECVLEDPDTEWAQPFSKCAKAKPDETVVFAWITYKSRAHRDRVNAKIMKDPRLEMDEKTMPFNSKRMFYSGFEVIIRI
ncbi:MAG TPA: DUF1428 domain-containing protein [Opitutaceae bacterium]|nr:DUF1428 domain-containing protein [Opitutaceae bacterium]